MECCVLSPGNEGALIAWRAEMVHGRGVAGGEADSGWRVAPPSQRSSVFSQEALLNLNFGIKVFIGILLKRHN